MQSAVLKGLGVAFVTCALAACTADDDAIVEVSDAAGVHLDATSMVPVTVDATIPPEEDAAVEPVDAATADAGTDAADAGDAAPKDAAASGDAAVDGGMVTLRIQNYDLWCAISVNNGGVATTAEEDEQFPAGTLVTLTASRATAANVFGYWVGTSGDKTAAHDTSMSTTVKVVAPMTVQACCPLATAPKAECPAPTP